MIPRTLTPLERDALREVANIGAGHAATALSQLTGSRIMISVPEVGLRRLEEIAGIVGPADHLIAAVLVQIMGDFTGRTLVVWREGSARALCTLLLHRPAASGTGFDSMQQSTLQETGNILCAAYLGALSRFLKVTLLPSVPVLVVDSAGAVIAARLGTGSERDRVLCVETEFRIEGSEQSHTAQFLLLPDPAALDTIFDAIQIAS